MSSINDGGPAFPCEEQIRCNGEVVDTRKFTGMSLRDYFAGQALAGLCASQWGGLQKVDTFVERSFEMADAMLKAREVKP